MRPRLRDLHLLLVSRRYLHQFRTIHMINRPLHLTWMSPTVAHSHLHHRVIAPKVDSSRYSTIPTPYQPLVQRRSVGNKVA